ncbi:unnamed protein product [Arabis nemorensis]|uniref:Cyclin-like domain-containing protein n=1 Tax=Arabis nemorensis TaxID=586526 RepID=A0A565CFD1_9BRAS|nr:unnamed protein product [Arabis nemorensis]
MDGMLRGNVSGNERDVSSVLSNLHDNEVIPWYFSREEVEKNSPSRRDGIDLKKEIRLRKSYCTFLKELGVKLKVPQIMIASAIVFCHRFFLRQSHAKNDRWTIATACMFLAGKVEETPRALKDVIIVSYEMIHKKNLAPAQRKEVYEQQKEILLSGEELVLSTLNFDLSVGHPYKPLIEAIKKYRVEEAKAQFPQVAWSFVNDCLWTTLCLQYKPRHIAAGAFFLAAEHLTVDLKSYGESLCQEFDITPRQLEDVRGQMLELYEKKHIPASQGSIIESSVPVHQPVSGDIASTDKCSTHKHSNSDHHGGSSKPTQNQSDNGSGEAERTTPADIRDDSAAPDKSRNVSTGDAPVSQSPNDLKLLRDKVKAKLEAKKFQGERMWKKDLIDEDDLIEKELEDVELPVVDDKYKGKEILKINQMGTEHGEILDGNHLAADIKGEAGHTEEDEMADDDSSTIPSRNRKMESHSEENR